MPEEKIIYEREAIKITNLRLVFGEKTYAISTISSVELVTLQPSPTLAGLMMGGGIFMFIIALTTIIPKGSSYSHASAYNPNWFLLGIGLLIAAAGFAIYRSLAPTYVVKFASTAGAVEAYNSTDKTKIQPIVDAINEAIIQKG